MWARVAANVCEWCAYGVQMTSVDGEDFEKANLLLAKFYVDKVLMSRNECMQGTVT